MKACRNAVCEVMWEMSVKERTKMATRRFLRIMILSGVLVVCYGDRVMAGPDTGTLVGDTGTFTGDQSAGIISGVDFTSPPITVLNVNTLFSPISPASGISGIYLFNGSGAGLTVNGGDSDANIIINTLGSNAYGIYGVSEGAPASYEWAAGLGILEPDGPSGAGGPVQVLSYSDITTNGDSAHGIVAKNRIGVYHPWSILSLESFSADDVDTYLTSVSGSAANIGTPVAGDNGGLFTLYADGTWDFDASDMNDALAVGETAVTKVAYEIEIEHEPGSFEPGLFVSYPYGSQFSDGSLAVQVTKTGDGTFDVLPEVHFEEFDSYNYLVDDQPPALWPDLQDYVDRLLADMGIAGAGEAILVINNGTITTTDIGSHGIFTQTEGGKGYHGRNGSFWDADRIPTPGGPGSNGGAVTVINNGQINTDANFSAGMLMVSRGGTGGHGGNGSDWRYGRPGGVGGTGGILMVTGSGGIHTIGDYSSGILALSEGGVGGVGGSGSGTTGGGGGGFGGKGGAINIAGDWGITTEGDKAHAIWAKSVGGSAGPGGSGGWLFGSPGSGGVGSDGGRVEVVSGGLLTTWGDDSYGIYAESVGGFGGMGGTSSGFFWSFGGDGGSGGSGGDVVLVNQVTGEITTYGSQAHAIFGQSIGGGGGSGGGEFGLFASLGGEGSAGGHGGSVEIANDGVIETYGYRSRGIYAQSIGGGGGDGGGSAGLVAIGGEGAGTSNGGAVSVTNSGTITTAGEKSHAIFAESIGGGGGDGGDSGGLISIGGDGGDGGNGGTVGVFNSGRLVTDANESSGIFAQSIGGGGGNGGDSVSIGVAIATVSIGGRGGDGGYSSKVDITNSGDGDVNTLGDRSFGIFAQSVGGGGGNGGFAVSAGTPVSMVNLAIGGRGGGGGDGNDVEVHNEGMITTSGKEAHGVFAQSVGGGGGSGGFAVSGNLGGASSLQMALGGAGGDGGDGDRVDVGTQLNPLQGSIATSGVRSYGILAQSVGGGGGDGGFAIAGSGLTGTSLNLAFGGSGGGGGTGGVVNVSSLSDISTDGNDAHALVAQSVGGGGGSGGFSLAASYGGGTGLNFSFGGAGGTGNAGGTVSVGTELNPLQGTITTSGDRAYGVLAQSLGGGGGAGGMSISGQLLGGQTIGFGFGGDGGNGGLGGTVDVESASNIVTDGEQSHGLMAQSVGGGGGAGGFSLTAAVTAFGGFNLSMGGDGGLGNSGGTVDVNNLGSIVTLDEYSHGIVAQSVGGGGGAGGASGSVMVNFSSLIPVPPEIPITGSANFAVSVGGDGGYGGAGGAVNVHNAGQIGTYEDFSVGIFGQSVGGGGGDGGKSVAATANISLPEDPSGGGGSKPQMEVQVDFALAIGGDGGNGNSGGSVDIVNSSSIGTLGDSAHAISAQSIGGGGGRGGDARSMTLSIDPSNWLPTDPPPSPTSISQALNISIGGDAGWGNNGGIVTVANEGTMITTGADAYGIFAQSIGGGGGEGGGGYHGLDWEDLGVPDDIAPFLDLAPIEENSNIQIIVGGQGGSSGDGNNVNVANMGNIVTLGDGSTAVLAQSIGAGGGTGGVGAHGSGTVGIGGSGGAAGNGGEVSIDISGNIDTFGVAADGIFAQSIGGGGGIAGNVDGGIEDFGIELNFGVGQNGGNAGDGGDVNIASAGNITTRGTASNGIFAQSIGGGGGLTGDISTGLGFAGSVGGDGSGGDITIVHDGDIETFGDDSHGIFAQSAGGQNDSVSQQLGLMDVFGNLLRDPSGGIIFGPLIPLADRPDLGGAIDVTVTGDVMVHGMGSHGIFAQSIGADGNGDISVTVLSGTVQGGSGSGAGVYIADGASNTLTNWGSVSALSGAAIMGGIGDEMIDNYGTVTGNVDLMTGSNGFNNYFGGVFNAGPVVYLGAGRLLSNSGTVSPGGAGAAQTTVLTGDFSQLDSGTYYVDLDFASYEPDRLNVSGVSNVRGEAYFGPVNGGWAVPGTHEWTILSSSGGVTNWGLVAAAKPSAVIGYELLWPNATDIGVQTSIDFAPAGLSRNQRAIANAVNGIQSAGGSESFAPFAAELLSMPDVESLGAAYDQLGPESYDSATITTFKVTEQYSQTLVKRMHSVRSNLEAMGRVPGASQKEGHAAWVDSFGLWGDQDADDGFTGFEYSIGGVGAGLDWLIDDGFLGGVSFGQSHTSLELDSDKGAGDIKSSFGSIYGSWFSERQYLDMAFSYGYQSFDNSRRVEVGELTRIARSHHNGDLYSAYVEAGRNFDVRGYILQPFAALQYMYLDEEGYRESGAEGVNLLVDDRYTSSLISDVGLRFYLPFERKLDACIPEVTVAWRHDFDVDDRHITAAFDGAPGVSFTTEGDSLSQDGLFVGCGVTLLNKKGVSVNVRYSGEIRSDYKSHMLYGGLRYEF